MCPLHWNTSSAHDKGFRQEKTDNINQIPTVSVVLPVFEEEEVLLELFKRLTAVLAQLHTSYEVIFVDDGSRDRTPELIRELNRQDPCIKGVCLARNFGQQIAVTAGMRYASGAAVILMDADLQDPPEVLPKFLEKWKEGYDVIYAVRASRKENLVKKLCYKVFYRLLAAMSDVDMPIDAGLFCLIDRKVLEVLNTLPEHKRFLPGLRSWSGFRQAGLSIPREDRYAGEVKYTLRKSMKLALDALLSFSTVPLRLAFLAGFVISILCTVGILLILYQRLVAHITVPGYATTVILILFLGAVQLLSLGILGEYLGRIYEEVKDRPLYVVRELVGLSPPFSSR